MPTIASSLSTSQPYIPAVNATEVGKFAGLHMHFPTFAAFTAAVTNEQTNMTGSSPMWADRQPMTIGTEPADIHRVWDSTAGHARKVVIRPGLSYTLASNANMVLESFGVPINSFGSANDISVDWGNNCVYLKNASGGTAWNTTPTIASIFAAVTQSGGGGAPSPAGFSTTLDLTDNKYSTAQPVTAPITLTAGTTVEGGRNRVTFIPNGSSAVTLGPGLVLAAGSATYSQLNRMTLDVEVIDGVAQAAWFVGALLTAGGGGSVPAVVTGLRQTPGAESGAEVTLDWQASAGATSYILEQRESDGVTWNAIATQAGLSFRVRRLTPSANIGFRVTAANGSGQSATSTVFVATVPTLLAAGFRDDFNVPDESPYRPYPWQLRADGSGTGFFSVKGGQLFANCQEESIFQVFDLGRKNTTFKFRVRYLSGGNGNHMFMRANGLSFATQLELVANGDTLRLDQTVGGNTTTLATSTGLGQFDNLEVYLNVEFTLTDNAGTWKVNNVVQPAFTIDPGVNGTYFGFYQYRGNESQPTTSTSYDSVEAS